MKRWIVLILFLASFGFPMPTAQAHSGSSEAFSNITATDSGVGYSLRIDLLEFIQAAVPGGTPGNLGSTEEMTRFLEQHRDPVQNYVFNHVKLYADGMPLEGKLSQLQAVDDKGRPFAQMQLDYPVSRMPELLTLNYSLIFDDVDPSHANYTSVTLNGERQEFIATYGLRDIRLGGMSFLSTAKQFLLHGVGHLFTGYDHMLFIAALVLGARSIKRMLAVVTAFTAAHTVTLLLAGFHVVALPGKFVESAIAFSIIYAALSNLFRGGGNHNLWLAFGFGLIHGFGFAGTLSELQLDSGQLAASLLFFNTGIEIGQVLLVLVLFPLLQYILKIKQLKWPLPAMSAAISLFGLIWFVQRLMM